jgi:hypothetical protein
MKNKFIFSVAALLLSVFTAASAAPVESTFTTTGTAGEWIADFTLTNNLDDTNNLYFFGVLAPTKEIVGSPTDSGWTASPLVMYDVIPSGTAYNNMWCCNMQNGVKPGQSVSGFKVSFNTVAAPTAVQFFAYAYGGTMGNPVFEGNSLSLTAVDEPSDVPEPASLALFGLGAGLLGFTSRRKTRV